VSYNHKDFAFMLAGGYNLRPNMTGAVTFKDDPKIVDDTPLGKGDSDTDAYTVKRFAGEIDSELSFDVTYDDAPLAENAFIERVIADGWPSVIVCTGIEGNTIAKSFIGYAGMVVNGRGRKPKKGDIHRGNISMVQSSSYGHEDGAILQILATLTGAVDTTGVDSGAAPLTATITANTDAEPTVITTAAAHGFVSGDLVEISGSNCTPSIDGTWEVTYIDSTHFSIPTAVTAAGTAGTATYASGGALYLQVPAVTLGGYTNWLVELQDSADDVAYAAVAGASSQAITAATVPVAYRIPVTGQIRRYSRLHITLTGAGAAPSLTLMGGLARF